jgi:GNAT superfamily N-acetyltransferase
MLPEPDLPFRLHEIVHPDDPLLPAWLALYCQAFPPVERIPPEDVIGMIARKSRGELPGVRFQALLEGDQLVALLASERFDDPGVLFLWYLALPEARRGQGLGSRIYRRLAEQSARGLQCILFDVEMPALAASEAEQAVRARRIEFYRRLGVRELTGVRYAIQIEPGSPPLPMHLMIHPLVPLTGRDAYELAQRVVDPGWLQPDGEPQLA